LLMDSSLDRYISHPMNKNLAQYQLPSKSSKVMSTTTIIARSVCPPIMSPWITFLISKSPRFHSSPTVLVYRSPTIPMSASIYRDYRAARTDSNRHGVLRIYGGMLLEKTEFTGGSGGRRGFIFHFHPELIGPS